MRDGNNNSSSIRRAIADQFESLETTLCLSDKVVVITEDRLELLLEDGINKIRSKNAWVAPAGILASCVAALTTTASFRDFLGIKAAAWQAVFLLLAICSFGWLVSALIQRNKGFGRVEFMNSIRVAGTRLSYSESTLSGETQQMESVPSQSQYPDSSYEISEEPTTLFPYDEQGTIPLGTPISASGQLPAGLASIALQCRNCGNLTLRDPGKSALCPVCHTIN